MDFGARVRAERKKAGLTIEELASRSGISTAALSKIERGDRNPSLQNALRIADAFGTTISDLLMQGKTPSAVIIRKEQGENLRDPESGAIRESLFPSLHGTEFVRYMISPGKETGKFSPHPPGIIEVFVVTNGKLKIATDSQEFELSQGDVASISGNQVHNLSNSGDTVCTFVLAILTS